MSGSTLKYFVPDTINYFEPDTICSSTSRGSRVTRQLVWPSGQTRAKQGLHERRSEITRACAERGGGNLGPDEAKTAAGGRASAAGTRMRPGAVVATRAA